jgi:hypothetical protein
MELRRVFNYNYQRIRLNEVKKGDKFYIELDNTVPSLWLAESEPYILSNCKAWCIDCIEIKEQGKIIEEVV